ncbi:MAG TPA: threo-3-hydroxy-L-aspartate ammonia-lyase [Thermoanaerobaculia bacterium]|nr:threo-3-hydroxy-L-aspartate ammonia-lyase [Thermoanaerobaculia bacterium]
MEQSTAMSADLFPEIQAAARRLCGVAHRTPIVTSRTLDERVGARVFLKCESFQRIGAFKIRGAWNAVAQLSPEEKRRGVIAFSSGNHAQAVALACREMGVQAVIVMPRSASAIKRAATEGYGAQVVEYDPDTENREEVARRLEVEHGYCVVPPYDDRRVVAGQGTVALEMLAELEHLDLLLAPCGGGGLLSGTAVAARGLDPGCRVIGIEPALADDATRSFRTGTLQTVHNPQTIADGTRTPSLGKVTFPLVLEYVADMQTVTEEAIAEAVLFLFYRMKLVVEPSGALGVAALLSGAVQGAGRVGVILSGGNIDGPTMSGLLAGRLP